MASALIFGGGVEGVVGGAGGVFGSGVCGFGNTVADLFRSGWICVSWFSKASCVSGGLHGIKAIEEASLLTSRQQPF